MVNKRIFRSAKPSIELEKLVEQFNYKVDMYFLQEFTYEKFKDWTLSSEDVIDYNEITEKHDKWLMSYGGRWGLNLLDYLTYRYMMYIGVTNLKELAAYGIENKTKKGSMGLLNNRRKMAMYEIAKKGE